MENTVAQSSRSETAAVAADQTSERASDDTDTRGVEHGTRSIVLDGGSALCVAVHDKRIVHRAADMARVSERGEVRFSRVRELGDEVRSGREKERESSEIKLSMYDIEGGGIIE